MIDNLVRFTLRGKAVVHAAESGLLPKTEGGWDTEAFDRFCDAIWPDLIKWSELNRPMTLLGRYGQACRTLEQWKWDDLIGPKPEGFDGMPAAVQVSLIKPHLEEIRFIIGSVYLDYEQCVHERGVTEEGWIEYRKRLYRIERKEQALRFRYSTPEQLDQARDAFYYSRHRKESKKSGNRKLNLLPSFVRKLFFKG